ncbi:MAG: hypothetical protein J5959_00530, partial [Butyrivibrio sp.]|nr:hypothetical protein [Butyrivibrio sp.]
MHVLQPMKMPMKKRLKTKLYIFFKAGVTAALIVSMLFAAPVSQASDDGGPAIVRQPSSVIGRVTELTSDADAYASKDTSGKKVLSFKKGEPVFVTDKSDGWYQIFWKGETYYIPASTISAEAVAAAEDKASEQSSAFNQELEQQDKEMKEAAEEMVKEAAEKYAASKSRDGSGPKDQSSMTDEEWLEALDKEFEEAQKTEAAMVEEVLRQQKAKRNALIWKIVIGVLVAA